MSSIDETAGQINAAGVRVAEALASIAKAKDDIQSALGIVAGIAGENAGETLSNYMMHLRNADMKMIEGNGQLNMAAQDGQDFIGKLYS